MNSEQSRTDSQYPSVNLYPGQHLHGFDVKAVTPIDELRAAAIELTHHHSGARLLHLYTDDTKNWFSISPITPNPNDDTGLTHILEHSVMAGSRNYPIREVFFEMMKNTLATYADANAWNYIDHAFYFGSSNVKKDLFNLAAVHFDSVFHPLLTEKRSSVKATILSPWIPINL